jgi:hypothetical protein
MVRYLLHIYNDFHHRTKIVLIEKLTGSVEKS